MQRLTDQRGAFDQADELVSLRARHNQIIEQLKPKQQQTAPGEAVQVEAGPDVQASLPSKRQTESYLGDAQSAAIDRILSGERSTTPVVFPNVPLSWPRWE